MTYKKTAFSGAATNVLVAATTLQDARVHVGFVIVSVIAASGAGGILTLCDEDGTQLAGLCGFAANAIGTNMYTLPAPGVSTTAGQGLSAKLTVGGTVEVTVCYTLGTPISPGISY